MACALATTTLGMFARVLGLRAPSSDLFRPLPAGPRGHGVGLRYLGTAGFVVEAEGHTIVLDPYVSRIPLHRLLAPLRSDDALLERVVPNADDVFVGHAHFDHILDAPSLCLRTGARLVGASAVTKVGRAMGLPASQLRETSGREPIASGPFTVTGLPSRHGKVLFGRVLFPGDITEPVSNPPRIAELKHGLVLSWHLQLGTFSMLHIDTADFIPEEFAGLRVDVLCLCAAGFRHRERYVAEAIELLRPRYVVPCHWDTMVTHIHATPHVLPGLDLPRMLREIEAAGATPVMVPILGNLHF